MFLYIIFLSFFLYYLHPQPLDQGDGDGRQVSKDRDHGDGEVFNGACGGVDHDRKQRYVVRGNISQDEH